MHTDPVRLLRITQRAKLCLDLSTREHAVTAERTTRLRVRLPPEVHALVTRAAALQGRSLTDFVFSAAHEAALRTIDDTTVMRLSAQDQQLFVEAVLNPPEPNEALQRAKQRYLRKVSPNADR